MVFFLLPRPKEGKTVGSDLLQHGKLHFWGWWSWWRYRNAKVLSSGRNVLLLPCLDYTIHLVSKLMTKAEIRMMLAISVFCLSQSFERWKGKGNGKNMQKKSKWDMSRWPWRSAFKFREARSYVGHEGILLRKYSFCQHVLLRKGNGKNMQKKSKWEMSGWPWRSAFKFQRGKKLCRPWRDSVKKVEFLSARTG